MKGIVVLLLCVSAWLGVADAAQTFFTANAEDGLTCTENAGNNCNCDGRVTNVTSPVKQGSRSYKMLDTMPRSDNGAKCFTFLGQTDYTQGVTDRFYSVWYNLSTGWTDNTTKNNMQWKGNNLGTNCDGEVKAIVGFQSFSGVRNIQLQLRHWRRPGAANKPSLAAVSPSLYTTYIDACPTDQNFYCLRLASPPSIPKDQWFHIEVFMRQSPTNGAIKLWYTNPAGTNTLVYDLAHADLDAVTTWCEPDKAPFPEALSLRSNHKSTYLLWNSYNSQQSGTAPETTLYSDDIRITDFQVSQASGGDTTPPNAPSNLTLSQVYPGQTQVTWGAPTGSGEQIDFATYNLERCEGNGCSTFAPVSGYNGTATSFLDTGLTRDEEYTYRVQACDDEGSPLCGNFDTETGNTLAGGLVAHWDGSVSGATVLDVENTGTDHDGTISGGVTQTTGIVGATALNFPGTDDWVAVPDHANLDFLANQNFTWQAWVKSTQAAAAGAFPQIYNKVVSKGVGPGFEVGLHDENLNLGGVVGRWYANVWSAAATVTTLHGCTNLATLGAWTHLAVRRAGSTLTLFENGAVCDTVTAAAIAANLTNSGQVFMGAQPNATDDFAGDLDEVKLYNYARSDTEIATDASPGSTLAMTAYRLHGVDSALGTWKAGTNRARKLRHNGSLAWRFQVHNDSATPISTPLALQCKIGGAGYALAPEYLVDQEGSIDANCLSRKFCVQADQVLASGTDGTSTPQLPLPAGTTNGDYVGGTIVTSATWPTISLAANELAEVQFRTAAIDITDGSTLCCRPSKGDGTVLDEYNVTTIGEACVGVHAGSAGLW